MENDIIQIAIIDDHSLFRQGLVRLLSESGEINVVFEAANGADMIEKLKKHAPPQVVLMDITMPVMDGYAATAWLKANYPSVKVLALSMFEDDKPITKMLKSGAGGYLLKESKMADVIFAIKSIHASGFYLNELVSGKLLRNILAGDSHQFAESDLSANEVTFLQLCCSELTYKEIADQMNLSPHTIDNYRQQLFQKYDIKSRTGLVLFAIKNDLIKL